MGVSLKFETGRVIQRKIGVNKVSPSHYKIYLLKIVHKQVSWTQQGVHQLDGVQLSIIKYAQILLQCMDTLCACNIILPVLFNRLLNPQPLL